MENIYSNKVFTYNMIDIDSKSNTFVVGKHNLIMKWIKRKASLT